MDHIIELEQAVIEAFEDMNAGDEDAGERFDAKLSDLISALMELTDETPSNDEMQAMIQKFDMNEDITNVPVSFVPVFVMRRLIRQNQIAFKVNKNAEWLAFVARYKSALLGDRRFG